MLMRWNSGSAIRIDLWHSLREETNNALENQ
jgi:hypothetical protein